VPLIVAPQAAGLATVPYLTTAEYRAAPTDVDLTSLVPGGSQQQQDDMLATLIGQASSWMDGYVHYTLGATLDIETARARVTRDGYVRVPTRGVPVQEIDSFFIGATPSRVQAVSAAAAADAWFQDNVIWMPVIVAGSSPPFVSQFGPGDRVFCRWSYVNGYVCTLLSATAHAGDTSLQLQSPLGVYAGTNLTIYDSGRTETIVVASTYTSSTGPGPATVPLVGALASDHLTVGISVSNLPARAKKAAVLATSAFIKTRGSAGLVLESIDAHAVKEATDEGGAIADLALAEMQLQPLVLPYYG
jgi:hypothetical protein